MSFTELLLSLVCETTSCKNEISKLSSRLFMLKLEYLKSDM